MSLRTISMMDSISKSKFKMEFIAWAVPVGKRGVELRSREKLPSREAARFPAKRQEAARGCEAAKLPDFWRGREKPRSCEKLRSRAIAGAVAESCEKLRLRHGAPPPTAPRRHSQRRSAAAPPHNDTRTAASQRCITTRSVTAPLAATTRRRS